LVAIKHITSRDNAIVKAISNLAKSPSARRSEGLCLLEGEHLAESYTTRGGTLDSLVLRDEADFVDSFERRNPALLSKSTQTIALPAKLFDELSSLSTPSGVLAIARVPTSPPLVTRGFVLALDDVQDPGNVGALIRTAAAAGVDQVWLSEHCAFAWSVKTLRAAQGAHFHVPMASSVELSAALAAFEGVCYATLPREAEGIEVRSLFETAFSENCVLVISNEGRGLSSHLQSRIDAGVTIPMANGIESLNAAVAGGIALFAMAQSMDGITRRDRH
jgi:RNA methyltransferase, TrmH family